MFVYMLVGAIVDRCDPKRVMLTRESGRGIAIAIVVVKRALGRPRMHLLILATVAKEVLEVFSSRQRTPEGEGRMSRQMRRPLYVTQEFEVSPSHEPAVLISERELERIIERLEDCKPAGWADLWLAGVGAGVAVALGAFVVALTLPATLSGIRGRSLGAYRDWDRRPDPLPSRLSRSAP